jgi:hypothetical protein
MENRFVKRLMIISVYIILLALIAFVIYRAMKPKETCTDKIKNQNEIDIDCGGICASCNKISAKDITVESKGLLESGRSGISDFWALVSNPNNSYGAKSFQYEIKVKDSSGMVIAQRSGSGFILPGEHKYVIENNLESANASNSIEFSILKTEWVEFNNYYEKPNLKVVNKNYNLVTSGTGYSEVTGLLKNESPYDFSIIKIGIILKDSSGRVVALNSTEMRTVKSGEEREFKAYWPVRFPGEVISIETQADVNIFESEAIIKTVTSPGNPSK